MAGYIGTNYRVSSTTGNIMLNKVVKEWDKNNIEPGGKNDKKHIKDAKKRKKSPDWQEWKKQRDIQEYEQWKQFSSTSKGKK